ncbi:uncharacterized protein J3D65DRAFT_351616 [Phyllosticta citribraziliensis]|uniref:Secreted protein n=1 Tax=Phyllosticta citribraziliensis TaxID=989973 RepID=A0ABR1LUI0_9PEZI
MVLLLPFSSSFSTGRCSWVKRLKTLSWLAFLLFLAGWLACVRACVRAFGSYCLAWAISRRNRVYREKYKATFHPPFLSSSSSSSSSSHLLLLRLRALRVSTAADTAAKRVKSFSMLSEVTEVVGLIRHACCEVARLDWPPAAVVGVALRGVGTSAWCGSRARDERREAGDLGIHRTMMAR